MRPYVEYRSEVLEADDDRVGDVYVSNERGSWWYDPDENVATVYEVDEPYENDDVRDVRASEAERQADLYDVAYEGTDTVADREAHVLSAEATNESVAEGVSVLVGDTEFVYALETVDPSEELEVTSQTLWIDTEYEFPLKEEVVVDNPDGDDVVLTERFESVTFNGDVDDETFAFDPPENASVEELE